jgi:hypothetical protein
LCPAWRGRPAHQSRQVIAADVSRRLGPWAYLLQEHVDGTLWRELRPLLDPDEVRAAHQLLAHAVLAVQSVRFDAFGELNAAGESAGMGLVECAAPPR